jgi:hypothetical protein
MSGARCGSWLLVVGALLAACGPGPVARPDAGPDADADADADPAGQPDAAFPPALELGEVLPAIGEAGEAFDLTGHHFAAGLQVFFGSALAAGALAAEDGTSVSGTIPPRAEGDPALVTVRVRNPDGAEAAAVDAFTYGVVETVRQCTLLPPLEASLWQDGEMPAFSARVSHPGVTEGLGRNARLGAQVGVGRADQPPASWTWADADWARDAGDDDVYTAAPARPSVGSWRWGFRFTLGGGRWVYCDSTGTDDGFDASKTGQVVVRRRPLLSSLAPARARAGATVTVTGLGLSPAGVFRFGAQEAVSGEVEATGNLARLVVPRGFGTVDLSFTLDGAVARLPAAFTFDLDPSELVVAAFSPDWLPVAGGRLTLTGAHFTEPLAVTVGGVAAPVATFSASELVVEVPALRPGTHEIVVHSNARTGSPAALLAVRARRSITVDGTLDPAEWLPELAVAENVTNSEWAGNELRALYVAYDEHALYLGLRARADPEHAIVGYLSSTRLTTGSGDLGFLLDGDGALDDMLSSAFEVTVPGFRAHYGFGLLGSAPDLAAQVSDTSGLRELSCAGPPACRTDFGWSRATVASGEGAVELAFPWFDGAAGDPPNRFLPFPAAGATLQLFVRLVANGGQLFPNQSLPVDPNATATVNGVPDVQTRARVSQVATVEVR